MPFQSWELRPHTTNSCLFTLIAAIIELEIEIKVHSCLICCFQSDLKYMEVASLKKQKERLITSSPMIDAIYNSLVIHNRVLAGTLLGARSS